MEWRQSWPPPFGEDPLPIPSSPGARWDDDDDLVFRRRCFNQAADWARQRGVPLICNEFGVYRAFVDPQGRARWITDVRISLERHNIG
jgi:hypothetical protein